jgi:hypothetical protein
MSFKGQWKTQTYLTSPANQRAVWMIDGRRGPSRNRNWPRRQPPAARHEVESCFTLIPPKHAGCYICTWGGSKAPRLQIFDPQVPASLCLILVLVQSLKSHTSDGSCIHQRMMTGAGMKQQHKKRRALFIFAWGAEPIDSKRRSLMRLNSSWRLS